MHPSVIFTEQYIILPVSQRYNLKPLFYFSVVIVLGVVDSVLYIKTCIIV